MKRILFTLLLSLQTIFAYADEGMWLLSLIKRLNYADMQKKGLQLTPEEIYSVNQSSMKDAILSFGGYCTAEVISNEGLILTNHHCGYREIKNLSSVEKNYLKNGFWAYNKQQELPTSNLFVDFFVKMDDVTNRIQSKLTAGILEKDRNNIILKESKQIEKEQSENGKYRVKVKSFFHGKEFYVFVYQRYNDVRLVGAPPSSIGKFGGDTDNWEWPRHTGDFAMFRVYGDANGNPAPYSLINKPIKPKHHFPISLRGFKPNDFAMVFGYPGGTDRYMPSWGIEHVINEEYPQWIEASKQLMDAMKPSMDRSSEVQIKYADKYASLANYWKNRTGMIEALKKKNILQRKRKQEFAFQNWYKTSHTSLVKYANVLTDFKTYYKDISGFTKVDMYSRFLLKNSELMKKPNDLFDFFDLLEKQPKESHNLLLPPFIEALKKTYENIDLEVEQNLISDGLSLYMQRVPKKMQANSLEIIAQNHPGNHKESIKAVFKSSAFYNLERLLELVNSENPKERLEKDPFYIISKDFEDSYKKSKKQITSLNEKKNKAYRLYIEALRIMNPKKAFYPDANFTPRLTYGSVRALPYNPSNDARSNYYTTLKGTIAKYKPGDKEFDIPEKLSKLYEEKDYGIYANEYGELPVNFLTNNDITGGNSGSPVINAYGELIGTAFDGNWEAMSGDIEFEKEMQRTIATDIRYVLFIVDKFAGAKNLIEELTIVR